MTAPMARDKRILRGLYGIADSGIIKPGELVRQVSEAIKGGVSIIQYRDKSGDEAKREEEARVLLEVCQRHEVPLIINDDAELAHYIGADGVHLGSEDMLIREARRILGDGAIIGASCYDEFQLALHAQQAGADYAAFGSFFPSRTKPGAVRAKIELLHAAKAHLDIPVAAIGGITPDNAGALVQAGADMIAVAHGLFGQADVAIQAQRYIHAMSP
jgi:thiamine-phosphate pyrophosphorylase